MQRLKNSFGKIFRNKKSVSTQTDLAVVNGEKMNITSVQLDLTQELIEDGAASFTLKLIDGGSIMDPSIPLVKISGFWYQMVPNEYISSSPEVLEKPLKRKLVNTSCPFCRDTLYETEAIKMDDCEHSCCKYCAKAGFYSKGKFYSCPLCNEAWNSTLTG